MASLREQVMTALFERLTEALPVGTVYRSRTARIARSEGTISILQPTSESIEALPRESLRAVTLAVEVRTLIWADTAPDAAVDERLQQVHAALLTDPTLGELVDWVVDAGTQWDFFDGDLNPMTVTQNFNVRFYTPPSGL